MTVCRECGTSIRSEARYCWSCGSPQGAATPSNASPSATATASVPVRRAEDLLTRLRDATAGEYEIRGEIGRGAMAAVFLGHDRQLNRPVAIKVMLSGSYFTEDMPDRFRLEARTAAKLDHPNIVKVYAVKEVDGLLLFVMNFVEGRALSEILLPDEALDVGVVQLVVCQVARALGYAHEEGVVHRDVKPGNILVDRRGAAIVADFGIAKVAEAPELTMTGVVIGTPAYISPEQVLGQPAAPTSDQYSLGVVAYRMLAGRMPFGGSALEMQWGHAKERAPELSRPDCPPEIRAALMRMLEKDPAHRWPSMRDVWREFSLGLTPAAEEAARARLAELVRRPPPVRDPAAGSRSLSRAAAGSWDRVPSPVAEPPMADASEWKLRALTAGDTVLAVGEEIALDAVFAGTAETSSMAPTLAWRSSDRSVATITAGGTVRALSPGTATLQAVMGGVESSVVITVVPARSQEAVARMIEAGEFGGRALELEEHELDEAARREAAAERRGRLRRRVLVPAVGLALAGAGALGAWDAWRSQAARPTNRQLGEALARDTMAGALVPAAAVRLAAAPESIEVGDTVSLSAVVVDSLGSMLPGREVVWTVSDTGVAHLMEDGRVVTVAPGIVTLLATAEGRADSTTLTVRPPSVAQLVLSPLPEPVRVGSRFRLTAAATDRRLRTVERPVEWSSSNPRVASVSPEGVVTARARGEALITARAEGIERSVAVAVERAVDSPAPAVAARGAPASDADSAAADPPPEALKEVDVKLKLARFRTERAHYSVAADTLRSVDRALAALSRRYPRSPQVRDQLRAYAAAADDNRRKCAADARLARDQGTAGPQCP